MFSQPCSSVAISIYVPKSSLGLNVEGSMTETIRSAGYSGEGTVLEARSL